MCGEMLTAVHMDAWMMSPFCSAQSYIKDKTASIEVAVSYRLSPDVANKMPSVFAIALSDGSDLKRSLM